MSNQPETGSPLFRRAGVRQRSREQLRTEGKALRDSCPRTSHADWKPAKDRPDPVDLLVASNEGRIPELIAIRHGRMIPSPFVFFRGAAGIMAADLAHTPTTGIRVQSCGDAHLMNFGAFATPERRLVFDINDFDETLPAPWEWDVKRLATSFLIASRSNGFSEADARKIVLGCVRSYRERMNEFAQMHTLDVWYSRLDLDTMLSSIKDEEARKRGAQRIEKAKASNVLESVFPKLVTLEKGEPAIMDNPPVIFHVPPQDGPSVEARVADAFARYRESLSDERRILIDRYQIKDFAIKVVGVGSVGTFCAVILMMADTDDPLFLQVKEAGPSVLEAYAGKSIYENHGQRVVIGQRLMQSASDMFLGWTKGHSGRQFYIRQLRDMKIKTALELFTTLKVMLQYAEWCGWVLAHAHARGGQPGLIAGYLGKSDQFDEALADFATAYAQQNERDYEAMVQAARQGRIEVQEEATEARRKTDADQRQKKVDDARQVHDKLDRDTATLRQQIQALKNELSGSQSESSELTNRLEQVRKDVGDWEFRRDKAKADFQKADSDLSAARKLLQEVSAKHDELIRESSGLETANDGLTKEKETKEKELGELECEAASNDASNRQTPDPPPQ